MGSNQKEKGFEQILKSFSGKRLFISQNADLLEAVTGFEKANRYAVLKGDKTKIGEIVEKKGGIIGTLLRQKSGKRRPYKIEFYNANHQLFMSISRGYNFFRTNVKVTDEISGTVLGRIKRRLLTFKPKYKIVDKSEGVIGNIISESYWSVGWGEMHVEDRDKNEVVKIMPWRKVSTETEQKFEDVKTKEEAEEAMKDFAETEIREMKKDFVRQMFTDADTFTLDFYSSKSDKISIAFLLAGAIVIDYDFHEY